MCVGIYALLTHPLLRLQELASWWTYIESRQISQLWFQEPKSEGAYFLHLCLATAQLSLSLSQKCNIFQKLP